MKLTDMAIRKAKATERPLKLFDGGGLFLLVEPTGGKLWRYRYRFGGAERKLSIGKYPDISLLDARRLHQEAREQLARGIDPGVVKRARKRARADLVANTFEAVAREWFEVWSKDKSPGHSKETLSRLEKNVFPAFGKKPAAEVRAADALEVCRMFEKRGSAEMPDRILTAISQVMRYAVVTERAERNPCQDLRGALQPSHSKPLPSITDPSLIADLLRAIDEYSGSFIVRSALQLAPLVFVRPGELRNAKWEDIDVEKAEWVFRYSKQRANVEDKRKLVVPLPGQAVAVLERLTKLQPIGSK
jgi:integrase